MDGEKGCCSSVYKVKGKDAAESNNRLIVEVPHVQQCYNWDCGLACVSMIFRMLKEPCDDVYTKDLDFLECGESVWTIDLAYMLNRHSVSIKYFTVTIGVSPSHHKKPFYRDRISEDNSRVTQMFEKAEQQGIHVEKRSLTILDIIDHLQQGYALIALVDWTQMQCELCDTKLKTFLSCITCHAGPFQGHYIVVCGYDRRKGVIFFKNPDSKSKNHEVCCVKMSQFDKARKSDGTDEDVLFIYNQSFRGEKGDI